MRLWASSAGARRLTRSPRSTGDIAEDALNDVRAFTRGIEIPTVPTLQKSVLSYCEVQ